MKINKFSKIKEIVSKELSCSAHDLDHTLRVYNLAFHLAENEKIDQDVLGAATLLHDIARVQEDKDKTGKTDHAVLGAKMALPILEKLDFAQDKIRHIQDCIISHRYKTDNQPNTMEAQILFDADKLDSIGAIGVARSFMWVSRNDAHIYRKVDINEYIKENLGGKINGRIQDNRKHSPQIEFEIKLKFLDAKLYTNKAKEICRERLQFYKKFLDRLEREINGEI